MIELERLLRSQGFGSRADCRALVRSGSVCVSGTLCEDPFARFAAGGLTFSVDGVPWLYRRFAYLALHKPAGYECSQRPLHHPGVYSLLPSPLLTRGVQAVGRLDEDTTGLLLLTDDGALIHRLTSPKWHVPKVYEVGTKHPVTDEQIARLLAGVVLDDDPAPVRAAACERTGERALTLTLTEGKYHQVKRMVAATGNRVETLHRSTFGALVLPDDLAPARWRWLDADIAIVTGRGGAAGSARSGGGAAFANIRSRRACAASAARAPGTARADPRPRRPGLRWRRRRAGRRRPGRRCAPGPRPRCLRTGAACRSPG